MLENPRQRMPRARAAITSGTVDMPTASAPIRWSMRISAGVSNDGPSRPARSEEHTSELQSQSNLVCRLLLEKKKNDIGRIRQLAAHPTSLYHCSRGLVRHTSTHR